MELGPKPGTSTCCLTISTHQLAKVREQFTKFHDVDFAMKEGLDLPKLLRRLENMKSRYRTAYQVADNFEALDQQLDQWTGNRITKVYTSMFDAKAITKFDAKAITKFDAKAITKLTATQRRFLLLPQQV